MVVLLVLMRWVVIQLLILFHWELVFIIEKFSAIKLISYTSMIIQNTSPYLKFTFLWTMYIVHKFPKIVWHRHTYCGACLWYANTSPVSCNIYRHIDRVQVCIGSFSHIEVFKNTISSMNLIFTYCEYEITRSLNQWF